MEVKLSLLNAGGNVILSEEVNSHQFVKLYNLEKLNVGRYKWSIAYGDRTFTEDFEIKSVKKLIKESISVDVDETEYMRHWHSRRKLKGFLHRFGTSQW